MRNSYPPAVLTLPHGKDGPGILRFPEFPSVEINLGRAHSNILLALQHQYDEQQPIFEDDRGWCNGKSLGLAHKAAIGKKISDGACTKYVRTLIAFLNGQFEAPPLIEKVREKGSRLVRELIIDDLSIQPRKDNGTRPESYCAARARV